MKGEQPQFNRTAESVHLAAPDCSQVELNHNVELIDLTCVTLQVRHVHVPQLSTLVRLSAYVQMTSLEIELSKYFLSVIYLVVDELREL